MKKLFIIACAVVVLAGICFFLQPSEKADQSSNAWPHGTPITCIIPWKEGGSADRMARQLVRYWEKELGTIIRIENREGAATLLGTEHFLKQPDDGSYIYIGTQMYMSAGVVLRGARFSMDDFEIINFQQFDPITIAVLNDSPYKSLDDLIKDIKARPGEVRCGLIYGGAPHLGAVVLREMFDINAQDITYDSGKSFRTALLDGQVDFIMSNANGDRAIQDKARVLAVADELRSGIWPEAPTFNEALGIKNFPRLGSARFVAVRKGVREKHPERFDRLVETYKSAFNNPEYAKLRADSGEDGVSAYRGPEQSNRMNKELHGLLEQYKARIEAVQQ